MKEEIIPENAFTRLQRVVNAQVMSTEQRYIFHILRHELRVAVEETLKTIIGDRLYSGVGVDKHLPIRLDQCLMGANQSLPPNPMEPFRTPQVSREFFWVDFALKFRDISDMEENIEEDEPLVKRTEEDVIAWLEQDFFEAFEEKLAEYFQHNDFTNTIPDWQNHQNTHVFMDLYERHEDAGGGTDTDKKILGSRRPNFLKVLTPESRKEMIKEDRMVGVHRANAHIPDGVAVLHLDRYIRLDMPREFEHNFDMFGIRIWPLFDKYHQVEPSKRSLFQRVSCFTQDEISRADWFFYNFEKKYRNPEGLPMSISNDLLGGFESDYHCRRSRFMLMSRFIVLWKWLRHQYNDYFGCMTDWFIINLAINSCLNDTILNFKFESQKLSKEEPKIRKRTDRGIRISIKNSELSLISKIQNFTKFFHTNFDIFDRFSIRHQIFIQSASEFQ